MAPFEQHILCINAIELSVWVAGPQNGAPVWLLHGFPECWYSWRFQAPALIAAGYRVFIPEMRGYGRSSAPAEPQAYELLTLCADIQGAMNAFGHSEVVMIGHDWGAPVAWHLALLEPQRVRALVALSVPFAGRPRRPAIEIMRELYAEQFNYILYFQEPGLAERELDADIERTLLAFMSDPALFLQPRPATSRLFEGLELPTQRPDWCSAPAFEVYRATFAERGFRGALNWYRNFERNWQRSEFLADARVQVPTLFMIGDRDPVGQLEAHTIARMPTRVDDLHMQVLKDCGHWIQSEQPQEVNRLLLGFLARLD